MREFPITRKSLWKSINNIKLADWLRCAERLGLPITAPNGGSSHLAIRKNTTPIDYTETGLISVVYEGMRKDVNEKVFMRLRKYGCGEDDIWRGLGML